MPTEPQFYFDRVKVSDLADLLRRFGSRAMASPFRSTVPLLALLKDDLPAFQKIVSLCGMPAISAIHLEYQVKSPKGRGKASHTDAMVFSGSSALALEAKWTEPGYPSVATWLKGRGPDNKKSSEPEKNNSSEVAEGWLDLLRPHARTALELKDFSDAVYQTLHRAASVCATECSPSLAYLQFVQSSGATAHVYYHAELARLHGLLGSPTAFPFHLIEMPISITSDFARIQNLKKGVPETDVAVRSALLSSKLFEFGEPRIQTINGSR